MDIRVAIVIGLPGTFSSGFGMVVDKATQETDASRQRYLLKLHFMDHNIISQNFSGP